MDENPKIERDENANEPNDENGLVSRRDFLVGLKKWSAIVIGGALLGGALAPQEARAAWVNGGGGGWVNGRGGWVNGGGGGGSAWVNKSGGSGGWYNRGTAWANRGTSWVNRSGWNNRSGSWVNRY